MSTSQQLHGCTVAVLVVDGFEFHELAQIRRALEAAGAGLRVVSLRSGEVASWAHDRPGAAVGVDLTVEQASAGAFNALLVLGAVQNPEALPGSAEARRLIAEFFAADKIVAAIGQGLQGVLGAGVLRERTVTSFPSVRRDLLDEGAKWVDAAVVVDHGLVTSRSAAADMTDFVQRLIRECATRNGPARALRAHRE